MQWLCGFANAHGGTIYVGIADDGEVVGVKNAGRLLEDIPNKAIAALGIIPYVQLHRENGREFLEISIEPQDFPINCKGRYYLRSGATNQLLRGVGLDTFLLRRRGRTWDSVPVPNVRVQDLSRKAMDSFLGEARGGGRMPDDVAGDDAESLLRSLHLLEGGRCTNAAVLLFHLDPMAVFSSCFVKVGYFDGSEILFQDEVGGPVIEQVDKTLDLLYAKYLRARIDYDGATMMGRIAWSGFRFRARRYARPWSTLSFTETMSRPHRYRFASVMTACRSATHAYFRKAGRWTTYWAFMSQSHTTPRSRTSSSWLASSRDGVVACSGSLAPARSMASSRPCIAWWGTACR